MTWLIENRINIIIPVVLFVATLIVSLWLRRGAYAALDRWARRNRWQGDEILLHATRGASILWCLIFSAYLALAVSMVPPRAKDLAGDGLWTLLVFSLTLSAANFCTKFIPVAGAKVDVPQRALVLGVNITRVIIYIIGVLVVLDIWGAPTSPILLAIALAAGVLALAFREALPNLFAGLQLYSTAQIKEGDYIKLETGEEGYVREIDWRSTRIQALDESSLLVPNRKLLQSTVVNYGRPLKKAKSPFRFSSRAHLKELTGLQARDLRGLVDILKEVPESVVYFHTHHFLEEHHYLTPQPANDFSLWVGDALGDEILAEKLATIDAFAFPSLAALRDRMVAVIEEDLTEPHEHRDAGPGREFYFVKSVSMILPTSYVAHDLREFVEVLRKLSLSSLYFHIFESRLRLGRASNDFSLWIEDSLDEPELAEAIARLDVYTYTLEGLRSHLIQLLEKRIK